MKTRSGKFFFCIPYDVPIKNIIKSGEFASGDPGVKTAFTLSDTDGTCVAYGDNCGAKIRKFHGKIDALNKIRKNYKDSGMFQLASNIERKIRILEEHLKNKVSDLHFNIIKEIVKYKRFYYPKFNNKQMERLKSTNKNTKREMNSISHFHLLQRLKSKAQEVECGVSCSNESRTTMVCTQCLKKNYNVGMSRVFECNYCNFHYLRDANAARNNVLKYIY